MAEPLRKAPETQAQPILAPRSRSGSGGGPAAQLKSSLRGHDYDTQVQMLSPGGSYARANSVQAAAEKGISGSAGALPHKDQIQKSFRGYDISNIQAHTGDAAALGAAEMGANAYATGNHVAFGKGRADLHTAAHEATHVVQQRAGVSLSGGVGQAGDVHEQQADAVADLVVQGKSAEGLLGEMSGGGGGGGEAVQRQELEPSAGGLVIDRAKSAPEEAPMLDACEAASEKERCNVIGIGADDAIDSLAGLSGSLELLEEFANSLTDRKLELEGKRQQTAHAVGAVGHAATDPLADALGLLGSIFAVLNGYAAAVSVAKSLVEKLGKAARVVSGTNALYNTVASSGGSEVTKALASVDKELVQVSKFLNSLANAMLNQSLHGIRLQLVDFRSKFRLLNSAIAFAANAEDLPVTLPSSLAVLGSGLESSRNQVSALSTLVGAVSSPAAKLDRENRGFLDTIVALTKTHGKKHGLSFLDVSTPVVTWDPVYGVVRTEPSTVTKMLASSNPETLASFKGLIRMEHHNQNRPMVMPGFGPAFELVWEQQVIVTAAVAGGSIPTGKYDRFDIIHVRGFGGTKVVDYNIWNNPQKREEWLDYQHSITGVPRPNSPENAQMKKVLRLRK